MKFFKSMCNYPNMLNIPKYISIHLMHYSKMEKETLFQKTNYVIFRE